jgi:hypothetical protein
VQLEPVHARHRYIHNDNFCLIDFVPIQTLPTVRKCHSVVTVRMHEASQCPPYGGFIVNNTDEFRCTSHRRILTSIAEIEYRTLVLRPGAQQRKMLGAVQADVGANVWICVQNVSSPVNSHASHYIRAAHDKIAVTAWIKWSQEERL